MIESYLFNVLFSITFRMKYCTLLVLTYKTINNNNIWREYKEYSVTNYQKKKTFHNLTQHCLLMK